jgi:DNA-binding NtrC family response regulator
MGVKSQVITQWTSAAAVIADYDPDIVFSDLRMPEASGMTIYRQMSGLRPELSRRFVLVTGDMLGARSAIEQIGAGERPLVLEKPFSTLDVRSVLAALNDDAGRR